MVVFGIGAGLRPGELVALRGDDISRHGRQVMVRVSGPAARVVPVTSGYAGAGRRAGPAARAAATCSAPARPTALIRTSSPISPGAWRQTRPRRACRCAGARSAFICGHLAAGTPVPVLLAITGIAEAGSLARYARHVRGISSSKGALRARWRAETLR